MAQGEGEERPVSDVGLPCEMLQRLAADPVAAQLAEAMGL